MTDVARQATPSPEDKGTPSRGWREWLKRHREILAILTLLVTIVGAAVSVTQCQDTRIDTLRGDLDKDVDKIHAEVKDIRGEVKEIGKEVHENAKGIAVLKSETGSVKSSIERIDDKLNRALETRKTHQVPSGVEPVLPPPIPVGTRK